MILKPYHTPRLLVEINIDRLVQLIDHVLFVPDFRVFELAKSSLDVKLPRTEKAPDSSAWCRPRA